MEGSNVIRGISGGRVIFLGCWGSSCFSSGASSTDDSQEGVEDIGGQKGSSTLPSTPSC